MWNIEKIVKKGDYLYAVVLGHPKATKHGYVLLHRIVMENHLNRLLDDDEIVHHINGNKKDNRIENLALMKKRAHVQHHQREHGRMKAVLKCPWCKTEFEKPHNKTHLVKGNGWTACSKTCRGKFSRMLQLFGRTHEVESAISENTVRVYRFYGNPEETVTTGSVETIRTPPEMVKI